MDVDNFSFSYNGVEYILWAWKGNYLNLGAGAEMGIYYGGGPHWLVDTNLAMQMTLSLNDQNGNIFYWAPGYDTWWITGFDPNTQGRTAQELTATYTVTFNDAGMYEAFYDAWHKRYSDKGNIWSFNDVNLSATLIF